PARAPTAAPSPLSLLDALPISPPRGRPAPPEPAVRPDLLLALAAAAAVPRPDPGPGRVRVPVRQGTVAPDPRGGDPQRAGHHARSEEHTSEPQSRENLVCRLLL